MRSNTKAALPTSSSSSSSSSSKNTTKQQPPTSGHQPHLSGAYIRSLVKQLSSSSSTARPPRAHPMAAGHHGQERQEHQEQAPPPPPPHKKQVRRRLHTSRPYQERLLNMAEARREIVTALKIHRASMRQAKEQQQQQMLLLQQQQQRELQEQSLFLHGSSLFAPFSDHAPVLAPMPGFGHGGMDQFGLPAQPLGLNLSFHGFQGVVDAVTSAQPSQASSNSYSYSSPSTVASGGHDASAVTAENAGLPPSAPPPLHRVLDEEEMAALYSIGARHDIEWGDTVSLATTAWWSELLEGAGGGGGGGGGAAAEESSGEQLVLEQHLDGCYHQDITLPHFDAGEFEGWDGEWFS